MENPRIHKILQDAVSRQSSDIHLAVGSRSLYRLHGDLIEAQGEPWDPDDLRSLLFEILTPEQKAMLESTKELDFSYISMKDYQFRVNMHFERGNLAATLRIIPSRLPTREELSLPPLLENLATRRKGLVLISGTAGSGKSTTLNYTIDLINRTRQCKIITIEDPIEFVHKSQQSLVIQREVGKDTQNFSTALKYALRQDPDVIVVGEMRDFESISMALTAAETGHLIFTTVHAPDAIETINRIIDVYPSSNRDQLYSQLASNLLAVMHQTLLPRQDQAGRILASEVMAISLAIRNMIRRGALNEIHGQLDSVTEQYSHSLEACLSNFVRNGEIAEETARLYAQNVDALDFTSRSQSTKKPFFKKPNEKPKARTGDPKILLVVQDPREQQAVVDVLSKKHFNRVRTAASIKAAWLELKQWNPEYVVVDLDNHEYDGFAECQNMHNEKKEARIILMTSRLQHDDEAAASRVGASRLIIKTPSYDLLLNILEE